MWVKRSLAAIATCLCCAFAWAQQGEAILTISGPQAGTGKHIEKQLNLLDIEKLGGETWTFETPWKEGARSYYGPPLKAFLKGFDLHNRTLRFVAINEYSTKIEGSFVARYPMMLAWKENGQPMSVRSLGPLWLMLPLHESPKLIDQHSGKMIWQLKAIEIR